MYSCVPMPDAKTARLRAAVTAAGGAWQEVPPCSVGFAVPELSGFTTPCLKSIRHGQLRGFLRLRRI